MNKYRRNHIGETIMPQIIDAEEQHECDDQPQADERCGEQRATLRLCLDEVASEATLALQAADLTMPVYFSVPSSGSAILTFMTTLDPTDQDWARATQIVCDVAGRKIQVTNLIGRSLRCVPSSNSVNLPAADRQHAGDPVIGRNHRIDFC